MIVKLTPSVPDAPPEIVGFVIVHYNDRGQIPNRTYTGNVWEACGYNPPTLEVGNAREDLYVYDDKQTAVNIAKMLSRADRTGKGFLVEPYRAR